MLTTAYYCGHIPVHVKTRACVNTACTCTHMCYLRNSCVYGSLHMCHTRGPFKLWVICTVGCKNVCKNAINFHALNSVTNSKTALRFNLNFQNFLTECHRPPTRLLLCIVECLLHTKTVQLNHYGLKILHMAS